MFLFLCMCEKYKTVNFSVLEIANTSWDEVLIKPEVASGRSLHQSLICLLASIIIDFLLNTIKSKILFNT